MAEVTRVFHLVTGEDVIAKVEEANAEVFALNDPFVVGIVQGPTGQPNVQLFPLAIYKAGNVVNVPADRIVYVVEPSDKLVEVYTQVSSKIALPTKSLIV